jgi:hypothetical protein
MFIFGLARGGEEEEGRGRGGGREEGRGGGGGREGRGRGNYLI